VLDTPLSPLHAGLDTPLSPLHVGLDTPLSPLHAGLDTYFSPVTALHEASPVGINAPGWGSANQSQFTHHR